MSSDNQNSNIHGDAGSNNSGATDPPTDRESVRSYLSGWTKEHYEYVELRAHMLYMLAVIYVNTWSAISAFRIGECVAILADRDNDHKKPGRRLLNILKTHIPGLHYNGLRSDVMLDLPREIIAMYLEEGEVLPEDQQDLWQVLLRVTGEVVERFLSDPYLHDLALKGRIGGGKTLYDVFDKYLDEFKKKDERFDRDGNDDFPYIPDAIARELVQIENDDSIRAISEDSLIMPAAVLAVVGPSGEHISVSAAQGVPAPSRPAMENNSPTRTTAPNHSTPPRQLAAPTSAGATLSDVTDPSSGQVHLQPSAAVADDSQVPTIPSLDESEPRPPLPIVDEADGEIAEERGQVAGIVPVGTSIDNDQGLQQTTQEENARIEPSSTNHENDKGHSLPDGAIGANGGGGKCEVCTRCITRCVIL